MHPHAWDKWSLGRKTQARDGDALNTSSTKEMSQGVSIWKSGSRLVPNVANIHLGENTPTVQKEPQSSESWAFNEFIKTHFTKRERQTGMRVKNSIHTEDNDHETFKKH